MHIRVSTVTGVTNLDEGLAFIREEAVPELKQQKGFRGLSVSGDRAAGVVGVLTHWDTEADLQASESMSAKVRQQAVGITGGAITVEVFEEVASEVGDVMPADGNPLRIQRISMDPSLIDENVAYFKSDVLPMIKATPGFRGLRNMINRETGQGMLGTVWADEASLQGASAESEARREIAASRGVQFGEVMIRELLFSAMNL